LLDLTPLKPNFDIRRAIEKETLADSYMCWTCSSCDAECPINITTNKLRPQKIVHMAYVGLLEELLRLPEIWYCLTCRKCIRTCPNKVRPADLIAFARKELARRKTVSYETIQKYQDLFSRLQRIRWHAGAACMDGMITDISDEQWNQWLNTPAQKADSKVQPGKALPETLKIKANEAHTLSCFTCSECSGVCPIFFERNAFDPQLIMRMVNLGLIDELLRSPSIWLCLGCERCSEACGQMAKPHQIIKGLQEMAKLRGFVDSNFLFRFEQAEKLIYLRFIDEINSLMGFNKE
jgi:heterodisulfide reductase subunit C